MALIWTVFVASALLIVLTARNLWRRAHGGKVVDAVQRPVSWHWDAMLLFLGAVGVISTVPGLFFGQPYWAIDHVWRAISGISGNAG